MKAKTFVAKLRREWFGDESGGHWGDQFWGKFHRHNGFDGHSFDTLCGAKINTWTYLKQTVNAPKKLRCQVCEKSFVAKLMEDAGVR